MAKTVYIKFKESDVDWVEVEVPNFYDPDKHHTVRFGANDKRKYALMKMPDNRVFNKITSTWGQEYVRPVDPTHTIVFTLDTPLETYGDGTVKQIVAEDVLHCVPDLVGFFSECYRIMGHRAELDVVAPYGLKAFDNPRACRMFTMKTFDMFSDKFRIIQRAENDTLRLRMTKK